MFSTPSVLGGLPEGCRSQKNGEKSGTMSQESRRRESANRRGGSQEAACGGVSTTEIPKGPRTQIIGF